jgi:hypothetical protein
MEKGDTDRMKAKMIILAIIIVIVLSSFIRVDFSGVNKALYTEIVDSLEDLPAPIQIETTGVMDVNLNGAWAHLTLVAEYTIVGRVVTSNDYGYNPMNSGNTISQRDVGIAWGFLSNKEVDSQHQLSWYENNRRAGYRIRDMDWYSSMGGGSAFNRNWSNNHLIYSNSNIRKSIKTIEVGDYVKIEGYLVNAKFRTGYTTTSTSRSDVGNGACETIYVTKVTWLKLK